MSYPAPPDPRESRELQRLRAYDASLEHLLAVHEEVVRNQSDRLEEALKTLRAQAEELRHMQEALELRVQERTRELAQANETLKRQNAQLATQNKTMFTREERVLDLKQQINALLKELGRPPQYSGGISSGG